MMLGENECNEEIKYFMEHGKYPPVKKCTCKQGLTDEDIDYYIHQKYFDEYYCWQGSRIPCWFE